MPVNTWRLTLDLKDVFHNGDLAVNEKAQEIVKRIRATEWGFYSGYPRDLEDYLEDLEAAEDAEGFNDIWNEIYEIADVDRVWIETF